MGIFKKIRHMLKINTVKENFNHSFARFEEKKQIF